MYYSLILLCVHLHTQNLSAKGGHIPTAATANCSSCWIIWGCIVSTAHILFPLFWHSLQVFILWLTCLSGHNYFIAYCLPLYLICSVGWWKISWSDSSDKFAVIYVYWNIFVVLPRVSSLFVFYHWRCSFLDYELIDGLVHSSMFTLRRLMKPMCLHIAPRH